MKTSDSGSSHLPLNEDITAILVCTSISSGSMYSVLVRFHAAGGAPEPRYLHGKAPLGCDSFSAIQDHELYSDLCDRQQRRLRKGQDPHSKLFRLLQCPPIMGPVWFRPDMTAEQHLLTFKGFLLQPPQLTRHWAKGCWLRNPTSSRYLTALKRDHQS